MILLCSLLAAGCGGGGSDSPTGPSVPGEEVYLLGGSAMLKVNRTVDFGPLGVFDLETEFTMYSDHGLVATPLEPSTVSGLAETEADAVMVGVGTGGSHTTTTSIPVQYHVNGMFYPAPRCEWELHIIETLFLSEVESIENSILGTIPVNGLGEDTLTDFQVEFDQTTRDYAVIGVQNALFTIFDVVLPDGTGCRFE